MKPRDYVLDNEKEVLAFLKSRYMMFHLSNIFFRDIQYGIREMFERRGTKIGYIESEEVAREFVKKLEKEKLLVPIDQQSWVLHYPEYKKPPVKPPAPAKPVGPAAPRPGVAAPAGARPSAGLPPLKSGTPAGGKQPSGGLPPLKSATPAGPSKSPAALPPLKSSAPAGSSKPSGGLPPLKSSASAAGTTPSGGLPPLKSSAPAGGAKPVGAPSAAPKKEDEATMVSGSGEGGRAEQEKTQQTVSKEEKKPSPGGLPPIKSSRPAGGPR